MGFVKKQYETLKISENSGYAQSTQTSPIESSRIPSGFPFAQRKTLDALQTKAIRSVNNMKCETLLEMRYLTSLGWDQIASQLNYS